MNSTCYHALKQHTYYRLNACINTCVQNIISMTKMVRNQGGQDVLSGTSIGSTHITCFTGSDMHCVHAVQDSDTVVEGMLCTLSDINSQCTLQEDVVIIHDTHTQFLVSQCLCMF